MLNGQGGYNDEISFKEWKHLYIYWLTIKKNGKVIQLEARCGPEGW